jgi:PAS domain S-box-containing protein
MKKSAPVDRERVFGEDELIVSKTDLRGVITYANSVFCRVAGYSESELLGAPHSIVRHPDMPRCVFKYLWDTIQAGEEVFAYVKNMARTGEYYWVLAHVTPSYDEYQNSIGYHSNRRSTDRAALKTIIPIYQALLAEEQRHRDPRKGLLFGYDMLLTTLQKEGTTYEEMIWAITPS